VVAVPLRTYAHPHQQDGITGWDTCAPGRVTCSASCATATTRCSADSTRRCAPGSLRRASPRTTRWPFYVSSIGFWKGLAAFWSEDDANLVRLPLCDPAHWRGRNRDPRAATRAAAARTRGAPHRLPSEPPRERGAGLRRPRRDPHRRAQRARGPARRAVPDLL